MKRISYIKFLLPAMILAQSCKIAGDGRATRGAGKEQQLWEIFDINGSEGVAAIIQLLPYYLIPILALFLILSVRKNVRQKAKIASLEKELEKIKTAVLSIEGIIDMIVNFEVFPVEFTIHTSKIIKIDDVENKVKSVGYHAIPKSLFKL